MHRLKMKGQSAMEYLMTYGWAIIIIAVVLGAIYQLGFLQSFSLTPKAQPGSCSLVRPDGPLIITGEFFSGTCQGQLPETVAQFNGQSSIITVPSAINTALNHHSFTVTAWINGAQLKELSGISDQVILGDFSPTCVTDYCLHLVVRNDFLYMGFYGDDLGGTHALNDNTWYFAAFTYDLQTNYKNIYLNGAPDNNHASGNYLQATGTYICIGQYWACTSSGNDFNGQIANIQIYNTSFSPSAVNSLYLEGIGGQPISPQYLVAWYPLNGNANDYSGNGYSGNAISGISYTGVWTNAYTAP